ncbi:translation elongation factor-like protein [Candidatus Alkanophaga liquidiphilum]|nr:23S rRNA C2501 and tRNA U34 5'-hydroxylation protein RlhA/YrrN/YrrO [Candidatus Alkanophaga liquidiphilum]RLG38234.1 MAG: translation elongation factor-like protein [Candidatus Alkanophagales archaeon]
MQEKRYVGRVTHYFPKISVAVVELVSDLKLGDRIKIEGATTDFEQEVTSMEIEKQKIEHARAGQSIGLKVINKVRENDKIYVV